MIAKTITGQFECVTLLTALEIIELLKPIPPRTSVVGLHKVSRDTFIVAEFDAGIYTLHLLENATQKEATQFLDSKLAGRNPSNPRLEFVGSDNPVHN